MNKNSIHRNMYFLKKICFYLFWYISTYLISLPTFLNFEKSGHQTFTTKFENTWSLWMSKLFDDDDWSEGLDIVNIVLSCYAQLHLSHDPRESSFIDSHASFFGSLWRHEHVPCTFPFVLLLFCLCVCWTPCLVLNPPFHNSKIYLLKTGCIMSVCFKMFWRTN